MPPEPVPSNSGSLCKPTPYYDDGQITLYCADWTRQDPWPLGLVDAIITDPPYGDTSLEWDRTPHPRWLVRAAVLSKSMWCFGSLRFWLSEGRYFTTAGWQLSQDVIWEKHNGSSFHNDRFKRVHEQPAHWYRGDWASIYKDPPVTFDAVERKVVARRKGRPTHHLGQRGDDTYRSEDGGPRLMRSVLQVRSEHGRAVHPTQKPLGILRPLIQYSCPTGGIVLDPFSGSGSTLLAARDLGRRAIGIEAREEYCAATVKRLAQGVLDAA